MGALVDAIKYAFEWIWEKIMSGISYMIAERMNLIIHDMLRNTLGKLDSSISDSLNMFMEIEMLPKLLGFVSGVGMILIVTKASWEILQLYIIRTEGQLPQTNVPTFISRIIVAIIFTFVSPFVATLSFQIGTAVSNELMEFVSNKDIDSLYRKELILDIEQNGLRYKTYCYTPVNTDVPVNTEGVSPEGYFVDTKNPNIKYMFPLNTLYPSGHEFNTGNRMTELYNKYCRPINANLSTSPLDDINIETPIYPRTIYDTATKNNTFDEAYVFTKNSSGLIGFATVIALIIFPLIYLLQLAIRVADLAFNIIVSPVFAFSYVNDTKSQALKVWTQNIISISLTQASQTLLFILFITTYSTSGGVLTIAFGILMIRSPHIIKEWTQSTGAGGVIGTGGKLLGGTLGKIFGK